MPQTLAVADAVELAVVERSGFIESRHAGAAIVLAPDGTIIHKLGDPTALVLPRSSMKPLQALACLAAGAPLEGERLGLATASHAGTDRHVAVVREILGSAGLGEDDLACPAAWPGDRATRDAMVREHSDKASIRMNCSGKHAAMLLACTTNGWNTASYLELDHPLQAHIREVVERLVGEKAAATAIDGCGAPVYATTLFGLARAIHRLGNSAVTSPFALHRSAGALVQAVRQNPWTIQGPGLPDTIATERLGVFTKHGAEGVMVMVAPDGSTVAAKILDGNGRAATAVALRLLERSGALEKSAVDDTIAHLSLSIAGGGQSVGAIRPTF
ncbi:asparaginase [Microbacterium marmarense]|uniref:Asparaginase n=1 Tax=Microbacterium marmarense TaxID=3122051 RepID=A0ABU8LX63_9MICO